MRKSTGALERWIRTWRGNVSTAPQQLEDHAITDRAGFDALESAAVEEQEDFAREWLKLKNRDADLLDLQWGQGLQRMARHSKDQGFGCLVFLVDELLLWLGEKDPHQFRVEINTLNTSSTMPPGLARCRSRCSSPVNSGCPSSSRSS